MGSVGSFLFGGSNQKNKSSSNSNEVSSSNSQSQNANVSGQQSLSNSVAGSNNSAYAPIAAAMTPTLGYTSQAGDMMAALLGLPGSNFSYNQPPPSPLPPTLPAPTTSLVNSLFDNSSYNPAKAQSAPPAPQTTQVVSQTPVTSTPAGTSIPVSSYGSPTGGNAGVGGGIARSSIGDMRYLASKADGGPVPTGQPTLVGEQGPEVFVPHTSGTVVPNSTPNPATPAPTTPNASSALNTFANSAGQNFVLDQGQKALSGASAANGTFDSGATGKALVNYGQQVGNTYLNDYINNLSNYAKLGLGGASAMTGAGGVSQSAGNSASSSFGYGSGSSTGQSNLNMNSNSTGTGSGTAKNGLLPDLARFASASGG